MKHHHEFESLQCLHEGTEENRAYYVPFAPWQDPVKKCREESERFLSLNGWWKMELYPRITLVPDGFYLPQFDDSGFGKIPVPSCWQMQGLDQNQYSNVKYPIPFDPPYVPHENPCGAYRTTFTATKEMLAQQVYLNFEGVDSFFYVWLNGRRVGYSQVSHSTSEFNVTPYLKEGENLLAVLVMKWSVGTYLECQDKFRMSGIFRDVYLLIRPKRHIRDFGVRTWGCENYTKAVMQVGIEWAGLPDRLDWKLYGPDGGNVAQGRAETEFTVQLDKPHFWTAETPELYQLILSTKEEVICQPVGIRDIAVKGRTVLLNGKRLRLKGVNRHDSDPVTGFAISYEQALTDLRLMKQHNVNAIRSSHYPNAPWFVQMCDEYGFYMIDEADVETHGVTTIFGGGDETTFGLIAQSPDFEQPILDRVQRCIVRDKNCASVVMWSLGNESGYGPAFEKAGKWAEEYDPTRLIHYEGSWHQTGGYVNDDSMLDVYSRMYNEPEFVKNRLMNPANTKPLLLVEYCHAMGNGPGDLEDYESLFLKEDGVLGGFVWEWCDHAIDAGRTADGRKRFLYGGDSGEFPHDGHFCVDGLVSPDRVPHTGLEELKNVWRPVRAKWKRGSIHFYNTLDFLDVSKIAGICWELQLDGKVIQKGEMPLPACAPHACATLPLPCALPEQKGRTDLRLNYVSNVDTPFVKRGDVLGFDQLTLRKGGKLDLPALQPGFIAVQEDEEHIELQGGGFRYVFHKLTGCFDLLERREERITTRPMGFNVWRAPTDNDRKIRRVWEQAGYDRAQVRISHLRIEHGRTVSIHFDAVFAAPILQPFLRCTVTWQIDGLGHLSIQVKGEKDPQFPYLPRFGLRVFLNQSFEQFRYVGYGPNESYLDKRQASWYGCFESTVSGEYVDYIKPQEHGSHVGCTELQVVGAYETIGVQADRPFSFRLSHYPQEVLVNAAHNFELTAAEDIELCIDYKNSGIGSNSCGPVLAKQYALREETFVWNAALWFENND